MRTRVKAMGWAVRIGVFGVLCLMPMAAAGQPPSGLSSGRDLQGVWDFRSVELKPDAG